MPQNAGAKIRILAGFSEQPAKPLLRRHTGFCDNEPDLTSDWVFLADKPMTMNTTQTTLNEAQLELLDLFALPLSGTAMTELKQLLLDFKFDQLEKVADAEWADKQLSQDSMMERLHSHFRTPYQSQKRFLQRPDKP